MKEFDVYRNGAFVTTISATKKEAKTWIKNNLISTHMGQWIKTSYGYDYSTTIGLYYEFIRNYHGKTKSNFER